MKARDELIIVATAVAWDLTMAHRDPTCEGCAICRASAQLSDAVRKAKAEAAGSRERHAKALAKSAAERD